MADTKISQLPPVTSLTGAEGVPLVQNGVTMLGTAAQIAASAPASGVNPGSYSNANITVDAKGRVTAASSGSGGSSGITALTGDITASGAGSVAATLANTAVTAGSYTNANITVDAKGRIISASNGTSGGGITSITGDGSAGSNGVLTVTKINGQAPATVALTGSYNDLLNKPPLGTAAALAAGQANGVATLDSSGKIPVGQIPASGSATLATLLKSSATLPVTQDATSYSASIDGVANRSASGLTINMLADSFGARSTYHPTDLDISSYQTWQPSTAYVSQEVVKYNGYLFYTNSAATSGTTPPTPSSLNDGSITWIQQVPVATKSGNALLTNVEMFSNGRLRWEMNQGYKAPLFGAAKVFIVNGGSNYTAPYATPLNGLRVSFQTTAGKITGVTILSPGRASGAHVINVLDTGSGSGAVMHVAGGSGTFSSSGCVTADFLTRLPDAVASTADIIIVGAPNNDITSNVPLATTIANVRSVAEQLVAAGKRVVLMAQTPSTIHNTNAMKANVQRYNRWLRDFCSKATWANVNGICAIALADASGYLCDGATDNLPIGGTGGVANAMTEDGLHTSQRGTQYQAIAVIEACRHWTGAAPSYPSRCYSAFDPYDPVLNPGGNRFEALPWAASEAIVVGQTRSNNGNVYACTAAGTTASSGGPSGVTSSITDGTVTWQYCFPAKMSVMLSTAGGGTATASGVTITGTPVKGLQLARQSGSATGTINISLESPWSNGQAGQRQVFTFSLGGGTASERFQVNMFFGSYDKLGILPSDLGVTPFVFETEWEISNIALLTQFNSPWSYASAGYEGLGAGRELMQSAGEMRLFPNEGKLIHRSYPMIIPPNGTNLGLQTYLGFNAAGAAGSATVTAKLNYFTFRRANVL